MSFYAKKIGARNCECGRRATVINNGDAVCVRCARLERAGFVGGPTNQLTKHQNLSAHAVGINQTKHRGA